MINIPNCLYEGIELPHLLNIFPRLGIYLAASEPVPLIPAYPWVAVEGIDGSGKSEFIRQLVRCLSEQGVVTKDFRMPGATAFGEELRNIMKSEQPILTHPSVIVPAMAANTMDVLERIVAPELRKVTGEVLPLGSPWLVSDRWPLLSGGVYQADYFQQMSDTPIQPSDLLLAYGPVCPPLIVYMWVSPQTSIRRRPDEQKDQFERMERRGVNAHRYEQLFCELQPERRVANTEDTSFMLPAVFVIDNNQDMGDEERSAFLLAKAREVVDLVDSTIRRVAR